MNEAFKSKRAVIALGGNALGNTPGEQLEKVKQASKALCDIIESGTQVVISHGNGPQVGIINLAFSESSERNEKIPPMPLAECTAMSEGYIGFHLECALRAELSHRGNRRLRQRSRVLFSGNADRRVLHERAGGQVYGRGRARRL